jgi:hypothetical protein
VRDGHKVTLPPGPGRDKEKGSASRVPRAAPDIVVVGAVKWASADQLGHQ